jgi:serine/threonine protein kinase
LFQPFVFDFNDAGFEEKRCLVSKIGAFPAFHRVLLKNSCVKNQQRIKMFCPKCGVENLNTSKFCKKCGKKLPDPSQIRQAPPPQFAYTIPQSSGLLGQVLDGKYRIDAKLGSGGMGDVYRATRMLIGDAVAIKVLHAHLARDAQAAERFRREAVTATQLRHRNIVALYDVGISAAHNVPYILMELAEGFSLRQIINQYRILPLDFVVTVTAQVCAALDEAHARGIVHRDIKPENIIANQTATGWQIKILDFGIAKLYNQTDIGLTLDGSAMGTPQYMSPEQCLGEPLDRRSDIYSVGILIYEMLAGTVPFKSPAASAIAVHQVQTPPAPPRSFNQNIPQQVETVVLRALEKQREMRQQTASQFSQELIQAATVAFKSGMAAVSAVPIAAPNVEPEFDAAGEAESKQTGRSHTLSSEILVENETPEQAVREEKTEVLPGGNSELAAVNEKTVAFSTENETEQLLKKPRSGKKSKKNTDPPTLEIAGSDPNIEPGSIFDEIPGFAPDNAQKDGESPKKEDLTLVFEDAEQILDEIFPDEHTENPAPEESKTTDFGISQPIKMPTESLPETENSPDVLASYSAETQLSANAPPTNSPPVFIGAENAGQVYQADFPQEIKSKAGSKNLLIFGGFGLFLVVFLGTIIGLSWWLFSGGQKSETAADTNSADKKQNVPPAGMVAVPGGEFVMGSDTGDEFSRPAHKVSVKPFFIDLTEVTNEEYKKFVDATGYKPPVNWKNNAFPEGKAKFPVTGVDWDAATAYAKWAGKRLPTEEEWEYAARGTDERLYPWGNEWKKEFANADKQRNGMQEVGKAEGKSPFGLFDMSGNAFEWTGTDAKAYPNGKMLSNESIEPKVIRGGFFDSSKDKATVIFRRPYGARREEDGYENTGFRCVKDVPEQ